MTRAGLLALAAPLLLAQAQPVLVPDVSQRDIEIVYSFTGARLLLFGAILRPRGEPPADIVVVVKGPVESIRVREKARVAGVWVNAGSVRYRSAPAFYAAASSRPIATLMDERTRAIYELGLDSLQLSPATPLASQEQDRFARGLVAVRQRIGLYDEAPGSVEITQGVLYRAEITIPARAPVGRYTAETFLVRNGRVLAAATRDITIRKAGFERFVARAADRAPLAYGLVTVALSVAFGWGAGAIARRT